MSTIQAPDFSIIGGSMIAPAVASRCVYVGIPFSHTIEMRTMQDAMMEAFQSKDQVKVVPECCSSLGQCFNQIWSKAWNDGAEYMLMLHSDVIPYTVGYLDQMLEAMDRGNFDLLHALVPIKDMRGYTSTAVGSLNLPWSKIRRLTIRESKKLPAVFTVEDMMEVFGGKGFPTGEVCMLNNTGLILVKLNKGTSLFPGFRQLTRVEALVPIQSVMHWVPIEQLDEVPIGAKRRAMFIPEDWDFGRWCAKNGLKVGGMTSIEVGHAGRCEFTTKYMGGEDSDSNFTKPLGGKS